MLVSGAAKCMMGRFPLISRGNSRFCSRNRNTNFIAMRTFASQAFSGGVDLAGFAGIYHHQEISRKQIKVETWEDVLNVLHIAADLEDPDAMYDLAICYLFGKGVEQNPKHAFELCLRSASMGQRDANNLAGITYLFFAKVTPRNIPLGLKYLNAAARKKLPEAFMNLGSIYGLGGPVSQDFSKALAYYQGAQEEGHPEAKACLQALNKYISGEDISLMGALKEIIINDSLPMSKFTGKKAWLGDNQLELFQSFANSLDAEKLFSFGLLIYDKDKSLGVQLMTQAANSEWPEGLNDMGLIHLEGKLVKANIPLGIAYLIRAANHGYFISIMTLGVFYEKGIGVPQNNSEALKYYEKAKENGLLEAQMFIDNLTKKSSE